MRLKLILVGLLLVAISVAGGVYLFLPQTAYRATISLERHIAGLEARTVQVGDLRWSYLEGGAGPPLVLLHGFAADKDNWLRVARHLTPHFHLIVPDLIGFGDSSHPVSVEYDISAQAERVIGLLDALGVESFHLGGSSMGGHIAGAIAAARPEAVASLWLLAPAGVAGARPSELFGLIEDGANPLVPTSAADFDATLAFVFSDRPFIPAPIAEHMAQRLSSNRMLLQRIFSQLQSDAVSLESHLGGHPVPTLIVWGREDRVLHPSGAAVLLDIMPNASVQMIEDDGHLPMIESPRRTASRYLEWTSQF